MVPGPSGRRRARVWEPGCEQIRRAGFRIDSADDRNRRHSRPRPPANRSQRRRRDDVRAFPLTGEIRLDGILDEAVYATPPPIDGFVQQEPQEGEPATEATEVWLLFSDSNIYVSARLHDSQPGRMIANEMRRDH